LGYQRVPAVCIRTFRRLGNEIFDLGVDLGEHVFAQVRDAPGCLSVFADPGLFDDILPRFASD
jgi:hypothetical protein